MPLSRNSLISAGKLGRLAFSGALLLALGLTIGCSELGSVSDPRKGLLDPTAVGRFKTEALVVPILSSLDRTVEEPNDEFATATEVRPEDLIPKPADYTVGRNDLVNVSVTDLVAPNVETVKTTRVSESGNISLPLIGQIKAAGLTESQLEKAISKAYRDANLIQNAQVSVTVAEARNRTFSVLGAVAGPGQYAILNADFRLLDAMVLARDVNTQGVEDIYVIRQQPTEATSAPATEPAIQEPTSQPGQDLLQPQSNAGGSETRVFNLQAAPAMAQGTATTQTKPTRSDDDEKYILIDGKQVSLKGTKPVTTTPAPKASEVAATPATAPVVATTPFEFNEPVPTGEQRVIRIPYAQLKNGDLRYNIVIRPQDMIIVPAPIAGEFYMGGHVARVGVYSLTARKITLKQAVVSAGMFDQVAIPSRTDVIRRIGKDKELFVRVDLDKVFEGSQPDIYLKPNDVVQVGTNAVAPFLAALRGAFRFTYGFGFLYDRNYAPAQKQSIGR